MIDSRCGLCCTGCAWKESHGCGGCIETMGHPFYGECSVALCCQGKGLAHCGECSEIPCDKLYAYSYLDPEHGDKPQGARVDRCRRAAKKGWNRVLLTSAGLEDSEGKQKPEIVACLLSMLDKPAKDVKVLFISAAATTEETREIAGICRQELIRLGMSKENIVDHEPGDDISAEFDMVYFTGGDTGYLLRRVKETEFDRTVKKMVYENKIYFGVSAGSLIATPNIGDPYEESTAGLALVNAYLSVHCAPNTENRNDMPLSHFSLTDNQALLVSDSGFSVIG